ADGLRPFRRGRLILPRHGRRPSPPPHRPARHDLHKGNPRHASPSGAGDHHRRPDYFLADPGAVLECLQDAENATNGEGMTVKTNARIAGFTFLLYIAAAFPAMVLFGRATNAHGIAAKLAGIAQHATDIRISVLLELVGAFSAL